MAQKTYLALGDSYTICEGVELENSWPYYLVEHLNANGHHFSNPTIVAKTGWRTDELQTAIEDQLSDEDQFDLLSLLIGVNNQYQDKPFRKYKREFRKLLKEAIDRSRTGKEGVFVVSIPDYGVTPFAEEKNKTNAIEDLKRYNDFAKDLCDKKDVRFYDITELSQNLSMDNNMLIDDKLHPNQKQYQLWVDSFLDDLLDKLK